MIEGGVGLRKRVVLCTLTTTAKHLDLPLEVSDGDYWKVTGNY